MRKERPGKQRQSKTSKGNVRRVNGNAKKKKARTGKEREDGTERKEERKGKGRQDRKGRK